MNYTNITDDSRKVKKGSLFVAIKGEHFDANVFIPDAIKKGATVIVSEKTPRKEWLTKVEYRKVNDARKELAELASEFYGDPSKKLKVIGVTGTDGKTTTSHMIYEILKRAGKKVDLISTVSSPGLHVTSPEPLVLQKLLAEMIKKGTKYVVLETTSHAIDQKRVFGIDYAIAVLTNITHEHLDYHKTFKAYRDTKLELFLNAKTSILNRKDKSYSYFARSIKGKKVTYPLSEDIHTSLPGSYNLENAHAAAAVGRELGVSWKDIHAALMGMKPPKGRLERIKNAKDLQIYIDFAHTPNALKEVLSFLKTQTEGALIAVFGCASERDVKKRPMMAKIATELADSSVFTAEDPRSEDINAIFEDMVAGITNKAAKFEKIPERGEAIYYAINKLAKKGDIVLITGKAHEKSMAYNGIEYPWSDFKAVEMALKGKVLKINHT